MTKCLITAALLLFPAAALAQEGGKRAPWMEACQEDITKFCPNAKGKSEVKACLGQHEAEVSEKCKNFKESKSK